MEEYTSATYCSAGWATRYSVVERGEDVVVMRARMSNGLIATPRIELLKGQSGFKVETQYTGERNMPERVCRLHPQFHVAEPKKAKIYLKLKNGSFDLLELAKHYGNSEHCEFWYKGDRRPNGEWRWNTPVGKARPC